MTGALFAERVGFLGAKQSKLEDSLAAHTGERAARSATITFRIVARYIRSDGGSTYAERDWLRRHNVDRIERWERGSAAILERISSQEVRDVLAPLVSGDYYYAEVASVEPTPAFSPSTRSGSTPTITRSSPTASSATTPRPASRASPRRCCATSTWTRSTSCPTTTARGANRWSCPSRFPNLLVNGSSGIAVGMATNIPPHNLREVIDATVAYIDDPDIEVEGLMRHIKGPDFPTGGIILGRAGIKDAYETGRGRVRIQARAHIEPLKQGKEAIVVTELPFMVKKGGDGRPDRRRSPSSCATRSIPEISDLQRPVRQARHAPRDRAQARRDPEGRAQQALQAHAHADARSA